MATQVKAELDALISAGTLSNITITDNGAGVLSFAKTFEAKVGTTATTFSVSHNASSASGFKITSSNSKVTPTISVNGSSYIIDLDLAYYDSSGAVQGPVRITPSLQAGSVWFRYRRLFVELTETGIKTYSYTVSHQTCLFDVDNLSGQVLSMTGLPSEDFIVFLDHNGAKRLLQTLK